MAANRWLGSSKHGNGEAEFLCCFVLGVEVQGNKRLCLPFVAGAPAWIDNITGWVGCFRSAPFLRLTIETASHLSCDADARLISHLLPQLQLGIFVPTMMAGFKSFATFFGLSLALAVANAANSSGCGKALANGIKGGGTGQSNKINFTTSKGVKRSFLLHLPSAYDANTAHALVFSFHGRSSSSGAQETLTKLSESSNNPHAIVVYPDGINAEWQGDPNAKTDDVGFTLDMINSLQGQYCVDTNQIYASGMSNGGGFSANILACDPVASKKIAAFAGISGAYYQGTSDANCQPSSVVINCNPGRKPVPILEFHGSADDTIPYNGGARRDRCLPTIPHFIKAWADRNGLGTNNITTVQSSGHVKEYEFGQSSGLRGINTHYWIDGMGHTWPNAKSNYLNGTPVVMDFFSKWTLANTPIHSTGSSGSGGNAAAAPAPSASTICPAQNGKTYTSGSKQFKITCASDTPNKAYGTATNTGDFAHCIAQCAGDSKCGHVVFNQGTCYTKSGAPSKFTTSANGSCRVAVKQ